MRLHSAGNPRKYIGFNPRTHTGCDPRYPLPDAQGLYVSIHAPTRGATRSDFPEGLRDIVSIHAPTRGATDIHNHSIRNGMFQSTHPHGVRRCIFVPVANDIRGFNPRTHTGCDMKECPCFDAQKVSIHAPTRGATVDTGKPYKGIHYRFNPRTHTGCDHRGNGKPETWASFNPRTHTGCDAGRKAGHQSSRVSIHAPTRGATVGLL